MSLWGKTDSPKDAPVWYARHALFNGKDVTNNEILALTGTDFETGDAVIYLSDAPLSGLSDKTVYYVRKNGSKTKLFDTRAHALALSSETGMKSFSASATDTQQMFIKHDRKDTTNDCKEQPALIAVNKETAALRVGGLVSPGWYRCFKYKSASDQDRVHLELLAGVKDMTVTPPVVVPKYTATPSHFSSAGDNGWDPYCNDNTLKILLHPTESITGTATVKILGKYNDGTPFKDKGLIFSNVKESTAAGDLVSYDADGYMTLTLTFNGTNDVSKEIYIVSGDFAGIWHGTINFSIASTNGNVTASIPSIEVYT